jgi:soluble lytic murein transglycosylase
LPARAYDRASADACALAPYAKLRAAQAYARAGKTDEAVVRARAFPDALPARDEAKIVLAEALAAAPAGRDEAIGIWRGLLALSPHGARWIDTAVRLAGALLDRADAPDHAQEAFDLTTRVVVEAPKLAESSGAAAHRARAAALLRAKVPHFSDALSDADRLKLAQAWLDAGEPTKAVTEAQAVLAAKGATSCKAASLRATALGKTKASAADAWGDAITACAGDDALVAALYSGGKSSLSSKRTQEGLERLAKVEQLFPKHRLADDARFHAALALQSGGDEARAVAMLGSIALDYPEGDMRSEATFRVALTAMARGDWAVAKAPLDEIALREPEDHHWSTSARGAYFRARVSAAMGDAKDAHARYADIVARYPLAFYMTQAYGRLAAEDPAAAKRALDDAIAREDGEFPTTSHPELHEGAATRAWHLLEVGEVDAAKRELSAAGLLADEISHETAWIVGTLYNRAGAPELGHTLAKGKRTEYLAHYPAGKWRAPWEVAFPRAFEPIIVKESAAHGIPVPLAFAIMREESSFYPEAKSPSNAFGLMQLIVPTARWMASGTPFGVDETSLKRPEVSIALGTKLLGVLRGQYTANPALAISAYNGGGGAVSRWVAARPSTDFDLWVEQIPWDETRLYTKRVLASEAAYAFLYDRPSLDDVLTLPTRVSK